MEVMWTAFTCRKTILNYPDKLSEKTITLSFPSRSEKHKSYI